MLFSDLFILASVGLILLSLLMLLVLGVVSLFTPKEQGSISKTDYKFNFVENQHYWDADR